MKKTQNIIYNSLERDQFWTFEFRVYFSAWGGSAYGWSV